MSDLVKTTNEIAIADADAFKKAIDPQREQIARAISAGRLMDESSYDLRAALSNNDLGDKIEQIRVIVLELTNGQDEPDWRWIVQLKDDKFAFVSGRCDYTGWGCQSACDWLDAETFEEALRLAPQDDRRIFETMLERGTQSLNTAESPL